MSCITRSFRKFWNQEIQEILVDHSENWLNNWYLSRHVSAFRCIMTQETPHNLIFFQKSKGQIDDQNVLPSMHAISWSKISQKSKGSISSSSHMIKNDFWFVFFRGGGRGRVAGVLGSRSLILWSAGCGFDSRRRPVTRPYPPPGLRWMKVQLYMAVTQRDYSINGAMGGD